MADDVLYSGVRGVTDLMVMPGLINLDFADIRAVMSEMGKAMMGTGEATGERRALDAAEAAISNPLLDDVSMKGARGVLINITGSLDMTLFEVDEAANRIRSEVDPDAFIIFGSTFDDTIEGRIRVSVVATGMDIAASASKPVPATAKTSGVVRSLSEARQNQAAARSHGIAAEMGGGRYEDGHAAPVFAESYPLEAERRAVGDDAQAREHAFFALNGETAHGGSVGGSPVPVAHGGLEPRLMGEAAIVAGTAVKAFDNESQRGKMANLFARVIGASPVRPSKPEATRPTRRRSRPSVSRGWARSAPRSACRSRRPRTTFSTFPPSCAAKPTDERRTRTPAATREGRRLVQRPTLSRIPLGDPHMAESLAGATGF